MTMQRLRCLTLVFMLVMVITVAVTLSSLLSAISPGKILVSNTRIRPDMRHVPASNSWSTAIDKVENIFWIVQISDIHISHFTDLARGPDLERFCLEYLTIIKPEVVLATGDLTDSKGPNGIESMQIRDEWIIYENSVKRCLNQIRTRWLDLRGNHDSFDVFDYNSSKNYFRIHSARVNDLSRMSDFQTGYLFTLEQGYGNYAFVGIDSASRPGPNRPFNFFGFLNEKQMQHLKFLASITKGNNQTVWFGHFPTSLIVHDPPVLRDVMSSSVAYLCGHLHTLSNLVPRMYGRHATGQLELELGDWKDNRIFRVMAFDHDLVSFADGKLGTWPVIIITNPKNNQFFSANEPLEKMLTSPQIRILVFSPLKIQRVEVMIDRHLEGYARPAEEGKPLYVLPWIPAAYKYDSHRMEVNVQDESGKITTVSQRFSLDGTQVRMEILPRLILMLNIYSLGKIAFGSMVLIYVVVLTTLRQFSNIRWCFVRAGRNCLLTFINAWIVKLWLCARVDVVYYSLVCSVLYLTFGPWFVSYLLSDRIGVVFVWGIIVQSSFIPGGITYFYGIFQFVTFTVPLTLILAHTLDLRRKQGRGLSLKQHLSVLLPALLLELFTLYMTLSEFPRVYGQTALLLGPLRTGSSILLPSLMWYSYRANHRLVCDTGGASSSKPLC